jgi:4-amino-4-deoxy-L-arabinose transferase-like glycosyltransferase
MAKVDLQPRQDDLQRVSFRTNRASFHLLLALIIYAVLLVPTLSRQGAGWDEQTDSLIAEAYLAQPYGWLRGSPVDPSQTRLPMLVVAGVCFLLQRSDLLIARWVSVGVGALTLVAVYGFCRREYDQRTGAVACIFLATSPFFLSFARSAFTEGDIYPACAFSWLLVCLSLLYQKRTAAWATATGIVLGLAISAKFTAIVTLPAIFLSLLSLSAESYQARILRLPRKSHFVPAALIVLSAFCGANVWATIHANGSAIHPDHSVLLHCLLSSGCWVIMILWALHHRHQTMESASLAILMLSVSLLTFLILPPEHLTNPQILKSLAERFQQEMKLSWSFIAEATALHLGSLLIKSGPVIGTAFLAGFVGTLAQWKRPRSRFLILLVACYFGGIVTLPIAQTHYLVPLLPAFAIMGSDLWCTILTRSRPLAVSTAAAAALLLVLDLAHCYPDYNLNGYQWLGARYFAGRSSIGYQSIVQTPSDGVQQVVEWLNKNAEPNARVLAYLNPPHLISAVAPDPSYVIIQGKKGATVIGDPDYVATQINETIDHGWGFDDNPSGDVYKPPWDPAWLQAHYVKVFSVQRAFNLEVAGIWERKDRLTAQDRFQLRNTVTQSP